MVNKDYQAELRQLILGWYAPCKIRFYPNSVTVTLTNARSSTEHLRESAEDFISQFDGDIKLNVITKSPSRFSIIDAGHATESNPTNLEQLFTDWLEDLDDDEEFDDESKLRLTLRHPTLQ